LSWEEKHENSLPDKTSEEACHLNKELNRLIDQKAAEKRGKGWALTTFLREAWGSTKEDLLEKS
jgi:hypothetical protein